MEIFYGEEGSIKVATHPDVSLVVSAIVGSAGLIPSLAAIQSSKDLAHRQQGNPCGCWGTNTS